MWSPPAEIRRLRNRIAPVLMRLMLNVCVTRPRFVTLNVTVPCGAEVLERVMELSLSATQCVLSGWMNGVRGWRPIGVAWLPWRPAVYPAAGEHRGDHLGVSDPLRAGDDVGVEHDEVGLQAGKQAAAAPLLAGRVGRRRGEAGDRVCDRDPLLGVPRLARVERAMHGG